MRSVNDKATYNGITHGTTGTDAKVEGGKANG